MLMHPSTNALLVAGAVFVVGGLACGHGELRAPANERPIALVFSPPLPASPSDPPRSYGSAHPLHGVTLEDARQVDATSVSRALRDHGYAVVDTTEASGALRHLAGEESGDRRLADRDWRSPPSAWPLELQDQWREGLERCSVPGADMGVGADRRCRLELAHFLWRAFIRHSGVIRVVHVWHVAELSTAPNALWGSGLRFAGLHTHAVAYDNDGDRESIAERSGAMRSFAREADVDRSLPVLIALAGRGPFAPHLVVGELPQAWSDAPTALAAAAGDALPARELEHEAAARASSCTDNEALPAALRVSPRPSAVSRAVERVWARGAGSAEPQACALFTRTSALPSTRPSPLAPATTLLALRCGEHVVTRGASSAVIRDLVHGMRASLCAADR